MNNDYKWETVGRCKFYTDGTTCTDIEVMDDAKEISFIYPKIIISRERLIEYLYHFSDFASMYKEIYDNIEGGKEN